MSNKGIIFSMVFICLLAGSFLRIWNLGDASFWVDEVNTVYAAESYLENGNLQLPSGMEYQRARIHTYVVALMYRYWGTSEFTSRLPSAIFGILSILVAYFLGKQLGGWKVGLMSSFLMTFSHFEVGWSRVTRMYAMLQFFTLMSVWAFTGGFFGDKHASVLKRISYMLALVFSGLVIGISTLYLHYLALFLPIVIFAFLFFGALFYLMKNPGFGRFLNRYFISFLLCMIFGGAIFFFVPAFSNRFYHYLAYTPAWAEGAEMVQNRLYLFEFLISPLRFPLAAFFFIGSAQSIVRRELKGWLYLLLLVVPLILLSFVFTHRVPTYLFYVYPFYLILAAYGFINIVSSEWDYLKTDFSIDRTWIKKTLLTLFGLVFFLTPWLRTTLNIPFTGDGMTNLAVTFNEWKEAIHYVRVNQDSTDIKISSLPQITRYYQLPVDFCLNDASFIQSQNKKFMIHDRLVDVYAGVPFIQNVAMLDSLKRNTARGWILLTKYHVDHDRYVSGDMRSYLEDEIALVYQTKKESVLIYQWVNGRIPE